MDNERPKPLLLQILRCVVLAVLLTFAAWAAARVAFDWFNIGMR